MRYFIYGKLKKEDKMQKIKIVQSGFYFEPNAMHASIFTDKDNDFASIAKVDLAKHYLEQLLLIYPLGYFELRKIK